MGERESIIGPRSPRFDTDGLLLERDSVEAAAYRLLDGVREGQGAAMFVVGDAGLGKTSVLDRICALAGPDVRIGSGRGDEMEASLPFCLFDQAVEGLGGRGLLSQGPADHASMSTSAARHHEVLRWVREQAAEPVLLVFDDLHWADPDSLSLISFVCRRIGSLPAAVIGALRPWPSAACEMSSRLVHDGFAWVERLAPLSESAAHELLTVRLGEDATPDVIGRASALCAGNPLLLEQVALAIDCGDHVPERVAGRMPEKADEDALTGVLTEVLLPRFAGLPEAAMRVAQAASVFGAHFDPMVAAEVTGLDEDDADVALEALWRSGLVRQESGTLLEFVHPLFAQSLYADLAPPVRRRLHGRAFRALAGRGLETEAAEHAIRGHLIGDPHAVGVVERTGVTALRAGALVSASRHLRAAAELAGTTAGVNLLLVLGQALLAAGQSDHAVEAFLKVLSREGLRPAERAEALRMLGRTYFAMGDLDRAAAHFEESATMADDVAPAMAAAALLDEAQAAMPMAGPAVSLPLAVRARVLSRGAPDDVDGVRRRAEAACAYITLQAGDAGGFAACAAAARAIESDPVAELSDLCWTWGVLDTYGMALIAVERFAEAEQVLAAALRTADRAGAVEAAAALELSHAVLRYRTGPLDRALAHARKSATWADLVPVIESFARVGEAASLLQSGLVAESLACCDDIEPRATVRAEGMALLWIWHIRAQVHLRDGRLPEACELYGRSEDLTERMGLGDPGMVPWARHAIAAYVWGDRPGDATRLIERLEACALPGRWPRIAAHTGRAWLAERGGEPDTAIEHFEAALALHGEVDLPLEQVATLLFYGAFLRRAGWPTRARPVLARASRGAEAIGAGWLGEQAREELTVAGGRRRRGGGSPAGLTGQEQRVARLAATGATNREIAQSLSLSVKTIEFHLQRIYTKLGIASRRQLIAMTGQGEADALPWQDLLAETRPATPSVVEPPGLAAEHHSLN